MYIDAERDVKMRTLRRGVRFQEGIEWRLPGLLYADDSEEDLRVMVERLVEACRSSSLEVNAGRSKVMVLNGEEGLECQVHMRQSFVGRVHVI